MFWWPNVYGSQRTIRINHTLILRQTPAIEGPTIQGGLPRNYPVEFARTTDGYLYFATGLSDITKWDGLALQVVKSGVDAPTTALTLDSTGSEGSIDGTYQAYVRFLDADGNVSNLSPVSNTLVINEATTVLYTNVEVPTEPNVVRRQILRNTAGNFLTFYVDIDTTNLFATEFQSTRTDAELQLQEAVPLFDEQGINNIANFHDPPPNDQPFISFYQNRLWAYGQIEYSEGNAQVTTGSTTVTMIDARVNEAMEGRLLHIDGADRYYTIESIDEAAQTLTLTQAYIGVTDKWAAYTILPNLNRRHVLSYSEPGQFDSWRANQNIVVASSDDIEDVGTGLISTQSFLFILQRRHIYRLTFFEDPILDGGIFLSARRGCINNRCWVSVDGFVYLLDDRGIYRFDGGDAVDEISVPIQDLFYFDRPEGERRLNWANSRFWHCSHDRNDSTIRFFVSFSGSRYPRHALAFNYTTPQWWIEEYPWPVVDNTLLKTVNPTPVTSSEANRVFGVGIGTLDNLDPDGVDTYLSVTSSGVRSVTVSNTLTLPSSADLAGVPVAILEGRGKRQIRNCTHRVGQEIYVDRPWDVKPDTTSKLRLGAIPYSWRGHWMRWVPTETQVPRRVVTSFKPINLGSVDLRVYEDYSENPEVWDLTWPVNESASSGLQTTEDSPDAVMDLSQGKGYVYLDISDMRELNVWKKDVVSLELRGYSSEDAVRIYAIDVEGALNSGGIGQGGIPGER